MPRLDTVLVVLLAMPATSFAKSEPARSPQEVRQDRRQTAVDHAWNERDARELADFERLTGALKDAGQDRMTGRYREINARVQAAMAREIEQAHVKSAQAAQDARLSRREWRGGRMTASMSGDHIDMIEPRDERHDLSDDARERDHALARYEEMARIGTMSTALQNPIERGDRGAMKQNIRFTESFLALMRRSLTATRDQMVEDRVGLREDAGERRFDGR